MCFAAGRIRGLGKTYFLLEFGPAAFGRFGRPVVRLGLATLGPGLGTAPALVRRPRPRPGAALRCGLGGARALAALCPAGGCGPRTPGDKKRPPGWKISWWPRGGGYRLSEIAL